MAISRIQQQYTREADSWKRLLEFILAENVHLKTRIAELAGQDMEVELLAVAEDFQNRFIQKDNLIALVKHDVKNLREMISRDYTTDGSIKNILPVQNKLRRDIETLNHEFNKLKLEFNSYLSEKL